MNKREQITQLIETYIKDYCPKGKNTLTAGEITNTTPATTTHEIKF